MADTKGYQWVSQVRSELAAQFRGKHEYYDYFDGAEFGSPDSEFEDGFHGGEVTYIRIFLDIIRRHPQSALVPIVERDRLEQFVADHAGGLIVGADDIVRAYDAMKGPI